MAPLKIPKITLPMGIELQAMADISKPPSNCALLHNLMIQLMPTLAGLSCVIKILNVIGALEGFLNAFPNLIEVAKKTGDVLQAISDMKDCLPVFWSVTVVETIKDILLLIIEYLK